MGISNRKTPPDRVLFTLLVKTDRLEIQRKLSALRDKDLAVSVLYFSGFEKKVLLSLLADAKKIRVEEEIKRNPSISYRDYRKIIDSVVAALSPGGTSPGRQDNVPPSWFRPGGKRKT